MPKIKVPVPGKPGAFIFINTEKPIDQQLSNVAANPEGGSQFDQQEAIRNAFNQANPITQFQSDVDKFQAENANLSESEQQNKFYSQGDAVNRAKQLKDQGYGSDPNSLVANILNFQPDPNSQFYQEPPPPVTAPPPGQNSNPNTAVPPVTPTTFTVPPPSGDNTPTGGGFTPNPNPDAVTGLTDKNFTDLFGDDDVGKRLRELYNNIIPNQVAKGDYGGPLRDSIVLSLLGGLANFNPAQLGSNLSQQLLDPAGSVFGNLPFNDQITQLIDQISQGIGGIEGISGGDLQDVLNIIMQGGGGDGGGVGGSAGSQELQDFIKTLGPNFLTDPNGDFSRPFEGESQRGGMTLENLIASLTDSGTNPFGPGLTDQELESQRNILSTTLGRGRELATEDIRKDAARRGLTSFDAPGQERLSRLDEETQRQFSNLAEQQLVQDAELRRASGQLGLSRQQTAGDLVSQRQALESTDKNQAVNTLAQLLGLQEQSGLGEKNINLGLQDILASFLGGERQGEREFDLGGVNALGDLLGGERGLQANQLTNLNQTALQQMFGQQGNALQLLMTLIGDDAAQREFNRAGNFGSLLAQMGLTPGALIKQFVPGANAIPDGG